MKKWITSLFCLMAVNGAFAQNSDFSGITTSASDDRAVRMIDGNRRTLWTLPAGELEKGLTLLFTLSRPGDVERITLYGSGVDAEALRGMLDIYVTYDPMNPGEPVVWRAVGGESLRLEFPARYGAHLKLVLKGATSAPLRIGEIEVGYAVATASGTTPATADGEQIWRNPALPVEDRVEAVLAAMTQQEKMELLREGWGIPGIPRLGIPFMNKVESLHGFSYGSGATIFPQAIAMAATWNKDLSRRVGEAIGDETRAAHTLQGWSPVLDVAQDARWGRMEETYGEDPVMVAEMGSAWIAGFQSRGLITTPKHFGGHGAPLGGRDSHDIGLSEREFREVHLVPFRHVVRENDCQSLMMAYSDYQGVPIAKSRELLVNILREEWGFDGYIVSDCGVIGNLTARKHYTALDAVEAADQALAALIATNCGDTYNNKEVIAAAVDGRLDRENLDNTCRTLLRVVFRSGAFDTNPARPLDWNTVYPGWNSPEHRELARQAAREAIVLLKNQETLLPLAKDIPSVAVIGPGADDLQPGDYSPKLKEGQLQSILTGIRAAVAPGTNVIYEKGCDFMSEDTSGIAAAVEAARGAGVAVLVLGDCSSSESYGGLRKTSGENNDYATLDLPGQQQALLEAVCATGTPVVLILQAGRPFNIRWASEHCRAILVNWLPGQEGGHAAADVIFGDYNPGGKLPVTFPVHVGQLPLYYNFKTSGRRYEYVDLGFYPLYRFGYGLSYTSFEYSDLSVRELENGNIAVSATLANTGRRAGDEVVQLYLTDLYASVKTRVMELKDFTRVHLAPGESRQVSFELTPYQFSLLNEQMNRVVEPGEFKICVGGMSPGYLAADRIKHSVGYDSPAQGVSATLETSRAFAADFSLSFDGFTEGRALVTVKNNGTLTDTGRITLYAGGENTGEVHHFELDPGQRKQIAFRVDGLPAGTPLTFATGERSLNVDR
jgi:beta-glucosidase